MFIIRHGQSEGRKNYKLFHDVLIRTVSSSTTVDDAPSYVLHINIFEGIFCGICGKSVNSKNKHFVSHFASYNVEDIDLTKHNYSPR